jgi:hypothetical protein
VSAASIVQTLTDVAGELDAEYHALEEPLPPEALSIMLAAIRDCRAGLNVLYQRVEADLLLTAGEKRFVVEGMGEVQIKRKTKRTQWDHDRLLAAVIARVMDEPATIFDEETGELLPYVTIGHNVGRRIRECVSLGAGKVTGIRAIGLSPDEFCVEEVEGYSVALPKAAS